ATTNGTLTETIEHLNTTRQELVRAEKLSALGSLVAGIAHELNTPIGNCVLITSKLTQENRSLSSEVESGQLRRSSLDRHLETSREALDMLSRNLDKSARLISSFKQVASDQKADIRRRFNLDKLVHDTAQSLKTALCESDCKLECHIDPAIELLSYPGSLSQVVTAIIENALVHAYENAPGGTITISAEYQGSAIKLSVRDAGKGISPENLPRIFDPFFTTRLGQGGSGLGLHIVYNTVINMLNGHIAAESTPGEGSCFTITLPIGT
ncbi:MAG: ATP-binding protein, partial [Burkholderiales bacterium]|nr:ATP-binding protein [Burkholderiales bacterium]